MTTFNDLPDIPEEVTTIVTDFEQLDSIIERYFPDKFFYLKLVLAAGYATLFINGITQPISLFLLGDPSTKKSTLLIWNRFPSTKPTQKVFNWLMKLNKDWKKFLLPMELFTFKLEKIILICKQEQKKPEHYSTA